MRLLLILVTATLLAIMVSNAIRSIDFPDSFNIELTEPITVIIVTPTPDTDQ